MIQRRRRWAGVCFSVVVAWFLVALIQSPGAYAEGKKIAAAGKAITVLAQTAMPIGDTPKHEVALTRRLDMQNSADPDFSNLQVDQVIITDYTAGTGAHQGFGVQTRPDGEKTFIAYEGTTKTVPKPDGSPEITFDGKWWFTGGTGKFKGLTGGGTYQGKVIEGLPTYEWSGEYEIKK